MDKLEMKTAGLSQENIQKIRELFPNAVTEVKKDGKIQLAVDFDVLRQDLSDSLIDVGQERYQMTWPGKRESVVLANSSTTDTLRPCREESVDFDNTQNLYIEGDNLTVLKLLRETYLGKVKMIYIDPPYNTGNDFIYKDDFAVESEAWRKKSGEYDEAGNRLVRNPESNGRYHSDWLSMMYPRLRLARDLLTDDGVIFISIDDNEQANLKKICDEVFGESNFVGNIIWQTATDNNPRQIAIEHEYVICYAKSNNLLSPWTIVSKKAKLIENQYLLLKQRASDIAIIQSELRKWIKANEEQLKGVTHYNNVDKFGVYSNSSNSSNTKPGGYTFDIIHPITGKPCVKPAFGWRWTEKTFWNYDAQGDIEWGKDETTQPHVKKRIETVQEQLKSIYYEDGRISTKQLESLFGEKKIFNNPKTINLVKKLIEFVANKDSIILDFFSGSATTAHAVMQLNAEDGGNRKFIMVQLPEPCDEKSEAYKAGYKNICEIGKERIRRAGKKIVEEMSHLSAAVKSGNFQAGKAFAQFTNSESAIAEQESYKKTLDIGFRVLKLDSSNMQDVYYNPHKLTQTLLETTIDNIKPDRTPLDLLFQVMLELGVPLSAKIEEKQVGDKTYYAVNGNDLIACFDNDIDEDVITAIAKEQPLYAAFKDKSFATDSVAINNEQLFKTYSPITKIKVV